LTDLIFISIEPWDQVWRRNQFVTQLLAQRHPKQRILWVNPANDVSNSIRKGRFAEAARRLHTAPPLALRDLPNVFLFTPIKLLPATLQIGSAINDALARRQIRAAARQLGFDKHLLWINPHYAAHMAGHMNESAVIYDITDDWSAMPVPETLRTRILQQDEQLAQRSDAIIVCSPRLAEQKKQYAGKVHLIPNGVDTDRYRPVCQRTLDTHPLTASWPRPVLAHTGTIHSDRTDVALVLEIARLIPRGTIALIGPDHLNDADRDRLRAMPNIRLSGPVPNAELPRIMSGFDVCIVPHLVDAFSESQDPLKLYEYLACGLPIVSTPIAGFRNFPELIHLATGGPAFAAAIESALAEGVTRAPLRQAAVQNRTWSACVDHIESVIGACTNKATSPPASFDRAGATVVSSKVA
jgi:glycosyltransferase involved in cell wall biosynthesis